MTAEVLEVDELLSWAQRVDDEVRVQLRLRDAALELGAAEVRLASGSRQLLLPAEVKAAEGPSLVTFSVPQASLGRDVWRLGIKPFNGGEFVRVRARLLAPATAPVALLPGPAPASRMRPPAPRTRRSSGPLAGSSAVRRIARRLPAPVRSVLLRGRAAGREALGRVRG